MRQTQLAAYEAVKPSLPSKRQQVLDVIRQHPEGIASFQIAEKLGWLYHYITPRITDLLDQQAIRESGKTTLNPVSNRQVTLWVSNEF